MLAGKSADGGDIVLDHSHAYFLLWPDENGDPSRMIVWRRHEPFDMVEAAAIADASEARIFWEDSRRKPKGSEERESWAVRLVQIPQATPLPKGFGAPRPPGKALRPMFRRLPGMHFVRMVVNASLRDRNRFARAWRN